MDYLFEFLICFVAIMGFAYSFHAPKIALIMSALIAGFGRMVYKILFKYTKNMYFASFIAAFTLAILSELAARKFNMPSSCFLIPSILVLVPGSGIYYTMNFFVNNEVNLAWKKLFETLTICGSISFGILLASVWSKSLNRFKFGRNKKISRNFKNILKN